MIKLNYGLIRNPQFLEGLDRLYRQKFGFRTTQKLSLILKAIKRELDETKQEFLKIADKHMTSLGDGNFTLKEGDDHAAAYNAYMSTPVEINMPRISANELFHVELSPMDYDMLKDLISNE